MLAPDGVVDGRFRLGPFRYVRGVEGGRPFSVQAAMFGSFDRNLVNSSSRLVTYSMAISDYRVSERGQMALPAEARRRWDIADGGTVEVADLGDALVIVPAGRGGLRSILGNAVDEAGGYRSLADDVRQQDPDLA